MDIANVNILEEFAKLGIEEQKANDLDTYFQHCLSSTKKPEEVWATLAKKLSAEHYPFTIHLFLFSLIFPHWQDQPETAPAWIPSKASARQTNIAAFMTEIGVDTVKKLHQWTTQYKEKFWQLITHQLGIQFKKQADKVLDLSQGVESPQWFPGASMNIVDSCFNAPSSAIAIVYPDRNNNICQLSFGELARLTNQIANSLIKNGFRAGDAIGIAMPMNHYAIAIYLGIIKMGGIVVSIADSFSSDEIALRLNIAKAKGIFTQDVVKWAGKELPLYEKIRHIAIPTIIVLPCNATSELTIRDQDYHWKDFLVEQETFESVACDPMTPCNILFSSGTTGTPKAIPWNHSTPIKAASDAFFHHNIQPDDVLAWPTNLGWMMGPWLIFAAFINHAAIALYPDAPKDRAFGEFIQRANVTMLGVVPSLVAAWRQSQCMENLIWEKMKIFSSTGECSNPVDMLYLMSLAGYKPIIEYCGGTEIGGAYLSSTIVENNCPSLFTTPTMGLDIEIIDEKGKPADLGEVAIIPPSIGLSTTLLNADHHQIYFDAMPNAASGQILRRHGDQIRRFPNGYFSILGRLDDTMNLGGIKVSAVEIERSLIGIPQIIEVAAIAVSPPNHGPSQLVIYAAATTVALDKQSVMQTMQKRINLHLNPLFKIHDIVFINELPKTASNKIMRRILRKNYRENSHI